LFIRNGADCIAKWLREKYIVPIEKATALQKRAPAEEDVTAALTPESVDVRM
jgi:hypothetical protein